MSVIPSLQGQSDSDSARDPTVKVGPPLDRIDWALAAVLALGALGMFWKVIFTPSMLWFRDIFDYTYPCARFIQQMCRHGQLPYWNPYLNCGQPLLENPNLLFFYPYTLFIVLLPINFAYPMFFVVHVALAGIGTFFLARRWGQSRQGAFFAGFIFAFSGPMLSLGNLYNHAACAAWMPWALLATDRAILGCGGARASRPLERGHPARTRERDAPATAGETPALPGVLERPGRWPAAPKASRPQKPRDGGDCPAIAGAR